MLLELLCSTVCVSGSFASLFLGKEARVSCFLMYVACFSALFCGFSDCMVFKMI